MTHGPRAAARRIVVDLSLGVGLGLLILGLGGRLAMTAFSLLTPLSIGFSLKGTGAVVLTGGLYGLLGGAIAAASGRWLAERPALRGLLLGAVLLAVIVPISFRLRQAGAVAVSPVLSFVLFAPLPVLFGIALARLERRFGLAGPRGPSASER
jgi:hypothetical protein